MGHFVVLVQSGAPCGGRQFEMEKNLVSGVEG